MKMDVYQCEECGEAFAVERNTELNVCPICESELWEFSHEAVLTIKEGNLNEAGEAPNKEAKNSIKRSGA